MIDLSALMGVSLPQQQPLAYMPGPTLDQYASSMPQMDAGGGGLGARLSSAMGGWSQPTGAGLSALRAPMATVPMHSNGLAQAIANDPGQQQGGPMGLYALLQRLGVVH